MVNPAGNLFPNCSLPTITIRIKQPLLTVQPAQDQNPEQDPFLIPKSSSLACIVHENCWCDEEDCDNKECNELSAILRKLENDPSEIENLKQYLKNIPTPKELLTLLDLFIFVKNDYLKYTLNYPAMATFLLLVQDEMLNRVDQYLRENQYNLKNAPLLLPENVARYLRAATEVFSPCVLDSLTETTIIDGGVVLKSKLYFSCGNNLFLSPLSLLSWLPSHLMIQLDSPKPLKETLKEISENKNNILFNIHNNIDLKHISFLFDYINSNALQLPLKFNSLVHWMSTQPLFKAVLLELAKTFLEDSRSYFSKDKLAFCFDLLIAFRGHEIVDKIKNQFLIDLDYHNHQSVNSMKRHFMLIPSNEIERTHLECIFYKEARFNWCIECIKVHLKVNSGKIDRRDLEDICKLILPKASENDCLVLPCQTLFPSFSGSKRKKEEEGCESSKQIKMISGSSRLLLPLPDSVKNENERVMDNTEEMDPPLQTYRTSKVIVSLPSSLNTLTITGFPKSPWQKQEWAQVFECVNKCKELILPLECDSDQFLAEFIPQGMNNVIISIASHTFNLPADKREQKVSYLNQVPCKKVILLLDNVCDESGLVSFILSLKHSYGLNFNSLEPQKANRIIQKLLTGLSQNLLESEKLAEGFKYWFEACQDISLDRASLKFEYETLQLFFNFFLLVERPLILCELAPIFNEMDLQGAQALMNFLAQAALKGAENSTFAFSHSFLKNPKDQTILNTTIQDQPILIQSYPRMIVQLFINGLMKSNQGIPSNEEMDIDQSDAMDIDQSFSLKPVSKGKDAENLEKKSFAALFLKLIENKKSCEFLENINYYELEDRSWISFLLFLIMEDTSLKKKIVCFPKLAIKLFLSNDRYHFQTKPQHQLPLEKFHEFINIFIRNTWFGIHETIKTEFDECSLKNPFSSTFINIQQMLLSAPPNESEKMVKNFLFLATPLCRALVLGNQKFLDYKRKFYEIFIKQGWIPPLEACFTAHPKIPFLLLDVLCQALPHLNDQRKEWVTIILNGLSHKPELTDREQTQYLKLFNYHVIQKQRRFSLSECNAYPIIFKGIMSYFNEDKERRFSADLGVYLMKTCLSQQPVKDKEWNENVLHLLKRVRGKILSQTDHDVVIGTFFKQLKETSPSLLMTLLKQSYVVSQKGKVKKLFPISNFIALALIAQAEPIDPEIINLCVEVLWLRQPFKFDVFKALNINNRRAVLEALWTLIEKKNIQVYTIEVINNLLEDYTKEISLHTDDKEPISDKILNRGIAFARLMAFNDYQAFSSTPLSQYTLFLQQMTKMVSIKFALQNHPYLQSIIKLLSSQEFLEKIDEISDPEKVRLFNLLNRCDFLEKPVQEQAYKLWKNCCVYTSYFINTPHTHLLSKVIGYIAKNPEVFINQTEAIYKTLFAIKSTTFNEPPIQKLSKIIQSQFGSLNSSLFLHLAQCFPRDMENLCGRPLNEEEQRWLKLSVETLELEHLKEVRPFIEKSITAVEDPQATDVDIKTILTVFDQVNFLDTNAPYYINPNILVLDKKIVELTTFRGYLVQLLDNVFEQRKISGVPEDIEERKKFYEEIHSTLKRIAFILEQKEPHECTAYLFQLGEIGAKCATQYQELHGIYHCLMQEMNSILIPYGFNLAKLALEPHPCPGLCISDNTRQIYKACVESIKGLAEDRKAVDGPSKIHQKMGIISYLMNLLPDSAAEYVMNRVVLLIKHLHEKESFFNALTELQRAVSLVWVLEYANRLNLKSDSLKLGIGQVLIKTLEGQQDFPIKDIRQIALCLHGMNSDKMRTILEPLSILNFEESDKLSLDLPNLVNQAHQCSGLIQPQTLKDRLILMLHDERWKYLRTELAKLPDFIESNVHNAKYIENTLSPQMGIYRADSNQFKYEDKHVIPPAKKAAEEIYSHFKEDYHVAFVIERVKQAIGNTIGLDYVYEWLKHHINDKNAFEQAVGRFFNAEFKLTDEGAIYLLKSYGILKKN